MNKLLYGVAYYDEYMPHERLSTDIEMMKAAGINLVRIAESTWSTHEPQNGVFDFSSVDRVLDAMHEAGIHVIVGTPTYAVPAWMVKEHHEPQSFVYPYGNGVELLADRGIRSGETIDLERWGVAIVEEE